MTLIRRQLGRLGCSKALIIITVGLIGRNLTVGCAHSGYHTVRICRETIASHLKLFTKD